MTDTLERLKRLVGRATCHVAGKPRTGTAFLVTPSHALTCAHLIGAEGHLADTVQLRFSRGRDEVTAHVLGTPNWELDIAVLKLARKLDVQDALLPLLKAAPAAGAAWDAFGHPASALDDGLKLEGRVADPNAFTYGQPVLQLSTSAARDSLRGASGAPVLIGGAIAGMLSEQLVDSKAAPVLEVVYAVKARNLREYLHQSSISLPDPTATATIEGIIDDHVIRLSSPWFSGPRYAALTGSFVPITGFLPELANGLSWNVGPVRPAGVRPLAAWHEERVVVLLGEAGIGKSFELIRWSHGRGFAGRLVDYINLRVESNDGLADRWHRRNIIAHWLASNEDLELFLDGVDEFPAGGRSFNAALNGFIDATDSKRLYLRLTSRPSAWTEDLANVVGRIARTEEVIILSLLPLEAADARETAERLGVPNPEKFLDLVRGRQAEPFASRPLTLQMLCDTLASGRPPPASRAELFEHYLCRVYRGHEERARDRSLTAPQRLEIASRIAAATLFSGRPLIVNFDRDTPGNLAVRLEELVAGSTGDGAGRVEVTRAALQEALDTGPFISRGDGTFLWSSRAYEEYLGARYLARHAPSNTTLDAVLVNAADPERRTVPVLRGAIGWLADIMPEAWRNLARRDPRALLDAEPGLRSLDDRAFLVNEWLKGIEAGFFTDDDYDRSARLGFLAHDGISAQLDAWLDTSQHPTEVVRAATRLAGLTSAAGCTSRLMALVEQRWEGDAERVVAQLALDSLRQFIRADLLAPEHRALVFDLCRRVLYFDETLDPRDNLLGYALDILWPEHLGTPEMLTHLRTPYGRVHLGSYKIFVAYRFPNEVSEQHFVAAIQWMAKRSRHEENGNLSFSEASIALKTLAARSVAHLDDPELLSIWLGILVDAYQSFDCPDDLRGALAALASSASFVRAALATPPSSQWGPLAVSHKLAERVGITTSALLEGAWAGLADAATSSERELLAKAVEAWTSWEDEAQVARLLAEGRAYPELAHVLITIRKFGEDPIVITTEVRRRRAEEVSRREPEPVVLDPPLEQRVQHAIDAAQEGGSGTFWNLLHQLARQPTDHGYQWDWRVPIWETYGWQSGGSQERARIVAAASAFLGGNDPEINKWLGRRGKVQMAYALMGSAAVRLLHAQGALMEVDDQVLARWAPAVVDIEDAFKRDEFGQILALLLERVPHAVAKTWVAVFEGETARLPFRAFHDGWCPVVRDAFMAALRRQNDPARLGHLLAELLRKKDDVAHHFAVEGLSLLAADPESSERERGRQVAFALVRSGAQGAAAVIDYLEKHRHEAQEILLRFGQGEYMDDAPPAANWPVPVVGRFAELLAIYFPPSENEFDGVHIVGPEEKMRRWRDLCLSLLRDRAALEGWTAVDELTRLERAFPGWSLVPYRRMEAVERAGVASWLPPPPAEVLRIIDNGAEGPNGGRVETGRSLGEPVAPRPDERARRPTHPTDKSRTSPVPISARGWLAVSTEWFSRNGGLSTLNRLLCRALAAAGEQVACLVPAADETERQAAATDGVSLVIASPPPGKDPLGGLWRRPPLPPGFEPGMIIGHGRITGSVAKVLAEDQFPAARRLHLFHMAPDEIEWFKPRSEEDAARRAEQRTLQELALAQGATAVAVGPRLYERYVTDLHAQGQQPLRLDPGFDAPGAPATMPPGKTMRVLMLGRLEDYELKGLDLAARAVADARRLHSIELWVRGAPDGTGDALRARMRKDASDPGLPVVVRHYTADVDALATDLRTASLVLMPSRSEGFGLVGLEAIIAGVPVLIGGASGLAQLIEENLPPEEARLHVVAMSGDDKTDVNAWSYGIKRSLDDRRASFTRAGELRTKLAASTTWARAARVLIDWANQSPPATNPADSRSAAVRLNAPILPQLAESWQSTLQPVPADTRPVAPAPQATQIVPSARIFRAPLIGFGLGLSALAVMGGAAYYSVTVQPALPMVDAAPIDASAPPDIIAPPNVAPPPSAAPPREEEDKNGRTPPRRKNLRGSNRKPPREPTDRVIEERKGMEEEGMEEEGMGEEGMGKEGE